MATLPRFCTFDRLLTTLLFLVIVLACGLTPMQTDSWWQLRAGHDMWASRRVLLTDVYSHTAYGTFWLNHEWLTEVIFYAAYRLAGLPGLTLFATALITTGWALAWNLAKGPVVIRFLWTALALIPSSLFWEPRPHAFSLLFLPLTVFLLVRRLTWWLPFVFLVWANVHGGVLLGFVLLVTGLGIHLLRERGRWWIPVGVALACVAAVTVTPLGLSFWTEIPKSLARISLYPLDEWRRPSVSDIRVLPFWVATFAFCGALIAKRRVLRSSTSGDLTVYACALALLPMAVSAVRHVGPFLMLAVPSLTLLTARRQTIGRTRTERPLLNMAMMGFGVIAVVAALASAYHNQAPRLRWMPVPAGALEALRSCPDNLYNRYDEGGYLIWFAPERKVFMDGRQDPFPPELVLEHIQMERSGDDPNAVFSRFGIHCTYLPTSSPTVHRLEALGWRTLFRDSRWVVQRD